MAMKLETGKLDATLMKLNADLERFRQDERFIPQTNETFNSFYQIGCRGQFETQSKFHCQFKFGPSPFLRLAPLKMEVVLLDPVIVVYYDVLTTREISELQAYAQPLLKRSAVYKAGKNIYQTVRTSKGAWIANDHSNLTMNIGRRLEDMTDLTLEDSEGMHILNYDLGGHYSAHYDYFNVSTVSENLKIYSSHIICLLILLTLIGN